MACEARIVRVLRTLEYPEALDVDAAAAPSFLRRPAEMARMVAWIEDRKVRGRPIADRAPLRTPGPGWEEAFFTYLRDIECPHDLKVAAQGGGEDPTTSSLLRGLSWLVGKAVACEFEDHGEDYNKAARQVLAQPRPRETLPKGDPQAATHVQKDGYVAGAQGESRGPSAPWSPTFLSALDAACRALGVEPPSSVALPQPPPVTPPGDSNSHPDGNDADRDLDARVLEALEALLAEAKKRVAGRDMALTADGGGDTGVARAATGGESSDELEGFAAGVCTGDEACDRVATVLRMLFLLDLRDLQDEVNVILALAQANKP